MNREIRTMPAQLTRAEEVDGKGIIEAVVLTYGTVDSYDTTFAPGVFNESMDREMPAIVWSHEWSEPIGRWTEYRDEPDRLVLVGQLDLHPDVPRARQAWAQLKSGTLRHFSVGFRPEEVSRVNMEGREGIVQFDKGILDETSVVIVGAVPGTKTLAVRTPGAHDVQYDPSGEDLELSVEALVRLLQDVEAGVLTADEAFERATAVLDAPAEEDELEDLDDEDLATLALLADEGDEDAADELLAVFGDELDADEYETWAGALAVFLGEELEDADDEDADALLGEDDEDDADDESEGEDEADASAEELDAEIEAALALVDELP